MTGDVAASEPSRQLPHTVWLSVVGATGLILAAICSVTAQGITSRTWDEVGDAEQVAALSAWSQVFVTLGIVALVGATVLAGVAEIASRTSSGQADDRASTGPN